MNVKSQQLLNRFRHERGAVLVISLIFLAVLTLVAVVAMQSTVLEQRMSANMAFKARTTESSEAGRLAIGQVMESYVFYQEWPAPNGTGLSGLFNIPDGLTVNDNDTDGKWDDILSITAPSGYPILDYTTPSQAVFNNGAADPALRLQSSMYVFQVAKGARTGSGSAKWRGYYGLGKSLGGGSGYVLYDIRSVSANGAGGARTVTATDYMGIPKP